MQDDVRPGVVALRCGEPHHDTNPTSTFMQREQVIGKQAMSLKYDESVS